MKKILPKTWLTKEEYNKIINDPNISRKDELMISLLYFCA